MAKDRFRHTERLRYNYQRGKNLRERDTLTVRQRHFARTLRLDPNRLPSTRSQASEVLARCAEGNFTTDDWSLYGAEVTKAQAECLYRCGLSSLGLDRNTAGKVIAEVKANGWKPTSELLRKYSRTRKFDMPAVKKLDWAEYDENVWWDE